MGREMNHADVHVGEIVYMKGPRPFTVRGVMYVGGSMIRPRVMADLGEPGYHAIAVSRLRKRPAK